MATAPSLPRVPSSSFPGRGFKLSSATGPLQDGASIQIHRFPLPARLLLPIVARASEAVPAEVPRERAERISDSFEHRAPFVMRESCAAYTSAGIMAEVQIPDDAVVLSFRVREDTSLQSILSFAEAVQGCGDSEFRGNIIRPGVYSVCEKYPAALDSDKPWVLLAKSALGLRNPSFYVQADSKADAERMTSALQPIIVDLKVFRGEQVSRRGKLD